MVGAGPSRHTADVTTGDLAAEKSALRARTLAAREAIGDEQFTDADASIAAHGVAEWAAARTVAAYLSFGREPPTRSLIEDLTAAGVRVLVPVIDSTDLDWTAYSGPAGLAAGRLGIVEPTGRRLGPAALDDVDVVIVPALAVDTSGNRLGRGRGYYDRALASVTVPVIAVVYDAELIDTVPAEPHDRPVDAVLQPRGITRTG
jgi:5-formyltetrahydrofolate cyclo-ligase